MINSTNFSNVCSNSNLPLPNRILLHIFDMRVPCLCKEPQPPKPQTTTNDLMFSISSFPQGQSTSSNAEMMYAIYVHLRLFSPYCLPLIFYWGLYKIC